MSAAFEVVVGPRARRSTWLNARRGGIGASESAAVLGDTAWGTPMSIFIEKTRPGAVKDKDTSAMLWGRRMEPHIARWSQADYPQAGTIHPSLGLLRSLEWPWLLATLDYRVRFPEGHAGPFEIKNVSDGARQKWWGDDGLLIVPKPYQVQVQQQMAVEGTDEAYIQPFFGGNDLPAPIRVKRDDKFIEEFLVGEVGDFWNFHVRTGIPPEATFGDRLWTLWAGERGLIADAVHEFYEPTTDRVYDIYDLVGIWRINQADKSEAEKEAKAAAFILAKFMGDATELRDPVTDEIIHTLRGQNTARPVDLDRLYTDYPEAFDACVGPKGWARIHRATKAEV